MEEGKTAAGGKEETKTQNIEEENVEEEFGCMHLLFNNRAMVLVKLGRLQDALGDVDRALRMDPTFVKAHYQRGTILSKFGSLAHLQQAAEAYQKAEDIEKEAKNESEGDKKPSAACKALVKVRARIEALQERQKQVLAKKQQKEDKKQKQKQKQSSVDPEVEEVNISTTTNIAGAEVAEVSGGSSGSSGSGSGSGSSSSNSSSKAGAEAEASSSVPSKPTPLAPTKGKGGPVQIPMNGPAMNAPTRPAWAGEGLDRRIHPTDYEWGPIPSRFLDMMADEDAALHKKVR
jgi:tetratricopeptide (TPR) repeat protein